MLCIEPASPMIAPPMAKMRTRTQSTFLPRVAATTSSSRIARTRRPNGERATSQRKPSVPSSSATDSASRKYWYCSGAMLSPNGRGMPARPSAPLVSQSSFSATSRSISPTPSVTMAK